MGALLIKSHRRPLQNAFLESHGQHSKQTSGPGFVSLPLRSKAGKEVPAWPSRQPSCLKCSKFPLFKAIQLIPDKHGLFLIPSLSLDPAPGSSSPSSPAATEAFSMLWLPWARYQKGRGHGCLGKQDNSHFVGLWPCTCALPSSGVWGELLLPWPQHPLCPGGR